MVSFSTKMLFINICLLKITAVVVVTFVGLHGIAVILVLFMVVVAVAVVEGDLLQLKNSYKGM